ncbi:MAG TPA: UDP-3-O-acyl-N-acetylglucosamine deacetylase [Hyphomicrobiales bacterium]|nr:UDP-3-O-acyl-N-acetylglucosamine deacetylase [Hyphomicrobiales bacterium]
MVGQHTIAGEFSIAGIGVHSGIAATVAIRPAAAGTGRVVRRGPMGRLVPAHASEVSQTELCTVLGEGADSVGTVEHLLAALHGLGVDNAVIEVDGPEMPILDGSARDFVAAIDEVGVVAQHSPRRALKVLRPIRIEMGASSGELAPHDGGLRLEVEIDFPHPVIGRQALVVDLSPDSFRRELMAARTFGFLKDVERLTAAGRGRGASLDNTVVLDDQRVLNQAGLRAPDEFVRHKMLDAVGDLSLAGLPLVGRYRSVCGSHRLNVAVVKALLADRSAWTVVEQPTRGRVVRADYVAGLQPALAPEID